MIPKTKKAKANNIGVFFRAAFEGTLLFVCGRTRSNAWNLLSFTLWMPRSLKVKSVFVATRSYTDFEMQTPLCWANASSLAAIFTPSPSRFSFFWITSPMFIPTRNSKRHSVSGLLLISVIRIWNVAAHSTASTALENSASTESPPVLKTRPWKSPINLRRTVSRTL